MAEWRLIPGYPDYEVSNSGDVRRITRRLVRNGHLTTKPPPYLLKPTINRAGYVVYGLTRDKQCRQWKAHRLVAMAFLGEPPSPDRTDVLHCDGNALNNSVANLRWGSDLENKADSIRHGTAVRGTRCHTAKLDAVKAEAIRAAAKELKQYGRNVALARQFGVSVATIKDVLKGVRWNDPT